METLNNLEMVVFGYSQPSPLFCACFAWLGRGEGGGFAPKYTDLLVKGSFASGFVKLKCRTYCFVKSYVYTLEKSSVVVVRLNYVFLSFRRGILAVL